MQPAEAPDGFRPAVVALGAGLADRLERALELAVVEGVAAHRALGQVDSHDIHDVMALCDRVSVMKNGKLVGTVRVRDVTEDDILGMIILGKKPAVLLQ